jgi:hypothetical protein
MSNEKDPKTPENLQAVKAPAVPLPRNPFSIRFLDCHGVAMAGMKCILDWRQEKIPGTTDKEGIVKFTVPTHKSTFAVSGTIHIEAFPGAAPLEFEVVMLSQMRPATEAEGAKARLFNLGYLPDVSHVLGPSFKDEEVRALDRFRFANRIVDTKTLAPLGPIAPPFEAATAERLENAHEGRGPLTVS